jgi:hypothetical protein
MRDLDLQLLFEICFDVTNIEGNTRKNPRINNVAV